MICDTGRGGVAPNVRKNRRRCCKGNQSVLSDTAVGKRAQGGREHGANDHLWGEMCWRLPGAAAAPLLPPPPLETPRPRASLTPPRANPVVEVRKQRKTPRIVERQRQRKRHRPGLGPFKYLPFPFLLQQWVASFHSLPAVMFVESKALCLCLSKLVGSFRKVKF